MMPGSLHKGFDKLVYSVPQESAAPYRSYFHELFVVRLNFAYLCGIILIPAAFAFDILIFPDKWLDLFKTRILSMCLCICLLVLSNKTRLKRYPSQMCHVFFGVVALTIAHLISLTGAYASPYYAGLILMFIGIAMILPWGIHGSLVAGSMIVFVHYAYNLLPALLVHETINWPIVWNSIYFLSFTFILVVIASGMSENTRRQIFVSNEREKIRSQKLKESKAKIDALLKAKNRFIANITHELKTPLSIIIGNSELLIEEAFALDDSTMKQLRIIQQATFQLSTHVDRIIAVSTTDDPDLRLATDSCNYVSIVENIFTIFEPKAQEERIHYNLNVPSEPLVVNLDVIRIEEILNNLIQNAFKFTESGNTITITVGTDGQTVYTEVADTGVGIPENLLDEIFERFFQADEALSKRHAGIGVGLYLVKRNVELHGGTIAVNSREGKGSSFRFTLPLYADQSMPVKNALYSGPERRETTDRRSREDRRGRERRKKFEYQMALGLDDLAKMTYAEDVMEYENQRLESPSVLIVEDHPGMMKVIVNALCDEYNLLLAGTGFDALDKLAANEGRISLILSDIMMPGMSGFDFCKAVMENEGWKHIPLIFVTALLSEEDQLKGYHLGATDYIVKPYNIKILKEKVAHWISRRQYELLLREMSSSLESHVEDVSRVKDIILHEIRNPLQMITGAEDLLQIVSDSFDQNGREEIKQLSEYLKLLHLGIESMISVVETSKLIGSTAELAIRKPEPVVFLFDDALAQCSHLLGDMKLDVDLSRVGENLIHCDKRMLTQVFVNLIRNAAEAIKEKGLDGDGLIRISSEAVSQNQALIRIEDNGAGMLPEVKERLFRFRFTTKKDGTGIGLNLSRLMLKLHQGDIKVQSEEGEGTTFLIYLPFHNAEKTPTPAS